MKKLHSVFALLALLLVTMTAHGQSAECERACVKELVTQYVDSLTTHAPDKAPLAASVRITENGADTQAGEGIWKTITEQGTYAQTFIDSSLNSAVFFGAFKEGDQPMLLATRFKIKDKQFVEVENLVSRPDERNRLINRHNLKEPNVVYDLAVGQPASRDQLIAIGNAYFDGIQNSTDEGVPMHANCNRRENGVMLLSNKNPTAEPCPIGFHRFNYITDIRDRRVAVVDEERGLVLIWAFFDVPGNVEVAPGPFGPSDLGGADGAPRVETRKIPRSLYIAELFKVVDGGLIRDIEAIMFNLELGAKSGWE